MGWDITNFVYGGWYRSRRNPDLRDPAAVPPGLADGVNRAGSHDHLRCYVRGPVPDLAHGPCWMAFFVYLLPIHRGTVVGELQLTPVLGRVRSPRISPFRFVLVFRSVPGWLPWRQNQKPSCAKCSMVSLHLAGR